MVLLKTITSVEYILLVRMSQYLYYLSYLFDLREPSTFVKYKGWCSVLTSNSVEIDLRILLVD